MPSSRLPLLLFLASLAAAPSLASAQVVMTWGYPSPPLDQDRPPSNLRAVQVAAGGTHGVGLREDGSVATWGQTIYSQSNVPSGLRAVQLSAGDKHTLALDTDGYAVVFGSNEFSQSDVPAGIAALQVAAGLNYSLVLRTNGTVSGWGDNSQGQTSIPFGLTATQIAAGFYHSLAIRPNGSVAAWGWNADGQCNVPAGLIPSKVAGGYRHSLALRADGSVVAWGRNSEGQCNVPVGLVATQIAAGDDYSMALRPDGTVALWGTNVRGQTSACHYTGVLQISAARHYWMCIVAAAHCTLDQSEVFAGDSATGTVRLANRAPAGGTVVGLTSDDPRVHVPASVTVPQGEMTATFPVTTDFGVTGDSTATIQTVYGTTQGEGRTVPAKLKVKRATASVTTNASVVEGSTTKLTLTVGLTRPTDRNVTFTLSELITNGTFNFPASITVPAGATSGKGYATVNLVSFPGQRVIELRHEGNVVATTPIAIKQLRGTLTFDAPSILSGGSTTGYLFLGSPVREALHVLIDCSDTNVVVPREVYVMAGARIVQFPVVTSAVAADQTVSMRAFYGSNATGEYPVIGSLRLLAVPSIKSLTLPASVYGNGKITGTVRLNKAAQAGGTIVQLSSSDPSLRVPASVTVPQGQYSATFVATASDVASAAWTPW
ncbi:hypothetical protein EON79_09665 [bacterium]|nr:MAG: hypothetical protein EON79_09665 [bacterium]